jgi:hypothetical protein
MQKNSTKKDPIPAHFKNIEEAGDFWDAHDVTDYDDLFKDADFTVDIQRRVFLTALEPKLAKKLAELAHKQGISTETLINVWLAEKAEEVSV